MKNSSKQSAKKLKINNEVQRAIESIRRTLIKNKVEKDFKDSLNKQ